MGCDIHVHVETKEHSRWWCFGYAELHLIRNYDMFAKMADVRNNGRFKPISLPKGLPDDISITTQSNNLLYVVDVDAEDEKTVEKSRAEDWVNRGRSEWVMDKTYVTHPDWHSHSWLTFNEFRQCVDNTSSVDYRALLKLLEAFEIEGIETRLVFWFDN